MHCNHSKSFNRNFISMQPTDCSKECLLQAAGEVLTLLTGRTCPAGQVTLAGGDVVPRYNTISTMCTPRAMARGCLTTIWQIQRYSPAGRGQGHRVLAWSSTKILYFAHFVKILSEFRYCQSSKVLLVIWLCVVRNHNMLLGKSISTYLGFTTQLK